MDSQRAVVRMDYSEQAIWRAALGNSEPLLCHATYGPIDARDVMPAGSMVSCKLGSRGSVTFRPCWHGLS